MSGHISAQRIPLPEQEPAFNKGSVASVWEIENVMDTEQPRRPCGKSLSIQYQARP